jgi:ComF family protein
MPHTDSSPFTPHLPRRLPGWLTGGIRQAVDLLLPPRCPGCGEDVSTDGLICAACWQDLRILQQPWCRQCGQPFDYEHEGAESRCGACLSAPPQYDHARAAFAYDGVARQLVLGLKHADRLHLAPALANWLYRLYAALPGFEPGRKVLLVPVPLHWRRLLLRRYNQSAELARHLAKRIGQAQSLDVPPASYEPLLIRRQRATAPQGSPKAPSRHMNVRGAFSVTEPEKLKDAHIILIDDVITTGATVEELARILKRQGAARVDVLAVTRVLKDG